MQYPPIEIKDQEQWEDWVYHHRSSEGYTWRERSLVLTSEVFIAFLDEIRNDEREGKIPACYTVNKKYMDNLGARVFALLKLKAENKKKQEAEYELLKCKSVYNKLVGERFS